MPGRFRRIRNLLPHQNPGIGTVAPAMDPSGARALKQTKAPRGALWDDTTWSADLHDQHQPLQSPQVGSHVFHGQVKHVPKQLGDPQLCSQVPLQLCRQVP
jgi:hypothetical protein